jgi:hypothetical protein
MQQLPVAILRNTGFSLKLAKFPTDEKRLKKTRHLLARLFVNYVLYEKLN